MTLPFIAVLQTSRSLPRPIVYHGSTESSVKNNAKLWLDAEGKFGDSFSICEVVRVERAVIECDKPEEVAPLRELKGHTPVIADGTVRCQKCNKLDEEHV